MKLKTPLFLILIVGSVCVIIFMIWPNVEIIKTKKAELESVQRLVDNIQTKNANIARLNESINSATNSASKDFMERYIPYERNEERVINAFNQFLKADGAISLLEFSVKYQETDDKSTQEQFDPETSADLIFGSELAADGTPLVRSRLPKERLLSEGISVSGKYENIKGLFKNIYTLDLMKKIETFSIESVLSETGTPTDILTANITVNYSNIPMAKINNDYENKIFDLKDFDFQPVSELERLLTQKSESVSSESTARNNPFLP